MTNDAGTVSPPQRQGGSWIALIDEAPAATRDTTPKAWLSDAEIERIRLEETCRLVIREELAGAQPSARQLAWKFVNSPFGLWLLSLLVVAFAAANWGAWRESLRLEQSRTATRDALDLEIGYRLTGALAAFQRAQLAEQAMTATGDSAATERALARERAARDARRWLYDAPEGSFPALHPTYAGHGLAALIAELARHERDPARRAELLAVLRAVTNDAATVGDERPAAAWIDLVTNDYMLARWRWNGEGMTNSMQ